MNRINESYNEPPIYTLEGKVNEISSILSYPNIDLIILLEGTYDEIFLNKFVPKNIYIIETDGKEKLITIMDNYFPENEKIIMIIDRDYEIDNCDNVLDRGFYFDYANLEMMIISDDEYFEKFFINLHTKFRSNLEIEPNKIKEEILNNLLFISLFRQENFFQKGNLRFENLNLERIFNNNFSKEIIIDCLRNINLDNVELFDNVLKNIYSTNPKDFTIEDLQYITNGHDFIKVLVFTYKKLKNKIECNRNRQHCIHLKEIHSRLFLLFNENNFKKTLLYVNIKLFEEKKNLKIIN